jgi:hypothetical protein
VQSDDGLWGFVDAQGKNLCDFTYQAVNGFAEPGLAIVQTEDGSCGYLADDGKLKIPAVYQALGNFVRMK